MGGFKVQGKQAEHARKLVQAAKSLAHAGCFAVVLEGVPVRVAEMVTDAIDVPTIGIGAGSHCDGQVLVYHDLLGIEDRFVPKFVRRYADIKTQSVEAIRAYADDVRSGSFPNHDESYHMADEEAEELHLYGAG
jgi:3-methyl-2-oxobutanoate hydroxymethyltransferase